MAIDSDTSAEERGRLIQQFKRGEIDVLCNVDIFSEGFDCPDIEFIQLARPTKSLSLYLQQVGRGLRVSEGKEKTIFLDNVGLYNRFGVPARKRHWGDYFEGVDGVVERNIERNKVEASNRDSHQAKDLSEGNDKVFLIHSTFDFDIDYAYERAKIINSWFEAYERLYACCEAAKFSYVDNIQKEKECVCEIVSNQHINDINPAYMELSQILGDVLDECIQYVGFNTSLGIKINNVLIDDYPWETLVAEAYELYRKFVYKQQCNLLKKHRIGKREICELYPKYKKAEKLFENDDYDKKRYFARLLNSQNSEEYIIRKEVEEKK